MSMCCICYEKVERPTDTFRCPNNHKGHNECLVNEIFKNKYPLTCAVCQTDAEIDLSFVKVLEEQNRIKPKRYSFYKCLKEAGNNIDLIFVCPKCQTPTLKKDKEVVFKCEGCFTRICMHCKIEVGFTHYCSVIPPSSPTTTSTQTSPRTQPTYSAVVKNEATPQKYFDIDNASNHINNNSNGSNRNGNSNKNNGKHTYDNNHINNEGSFSLPARMIPTLLHPNSALLEMQIADRKEKERVKEKAPKERKVSENSDCFKCDTLEHECDFLQDQIEVLQSYIKTIESETSKILSELTTTNSPN